MAECGRKSSTATQPPSTIKQQSKSSDENDPYVINKNNDTSTRSSGGILSCIIASKSNSVDCFQVTELGCHSPVVSQSQMLIDNNTEFNITCEYIDIKSIDHCLPYIDNGVVNNDDTDTIAINDEVLFEYNVDIANRDTQTSQIRKRNNVNNNYSTYNNDDHSSREDQDEHMYTSSDDKKTHEQTHKEADKEADEDDFLVIETIITYHYVNEYSQSIFNDFDDRNKMIDDHDAHVPVGLTDILEKKKKKKYYPPSETDSNVSIPTFDSRMTCPSYGGSYYQRSDDYYFDPGGKFGLMMQHMHDAEHYTNSEGDWSSFDGFDDDESMIECKNSGVDDGSRENEWNYAFEHDVTNFHFGGYDQYCGSEWQWEEESILSNQYNNDNQWQFTDQLYQDVQEQITTAGDTIEKPATTIQHTRVLRDKLVRELERCKSTDAINENSSDDHNMYINNTTAQPRSTSMSKQMISRKDSEAKRFTTKKNSS